MKITAYLILLFLIFCLLILASRISVSLLHIEDRVKVFSEQKNITIIIEDAR